MNGNMYETASGRQINLDELDQGYPDTMRFLRQKIAECDDWARFQSLTRRHVVCVATRAFGRSRVHEHPLSELQLDLSGQLGIVLGQTAGTNTPSFLRFRAL